MTHHNTVEKKTIDELTLADDYMFAQVMREPTYLKPVLEEILQIKISKIRLIEPQKTQKEGYDSKGIRLDVYAVDENSIIYNIEMQTSNKYDLPKRIRYYQSILDVSILKPGENYNKLNKTFVIFICNYDPFNAGQLVYTFETVCKEVPGLRLKDEAYKMILNTKGEHGIISQRLKEFMIYLDENRVTGAFSKELDDAVNAVKANEERRLEYMMLWVRDNEMRAEGREEGRAEGREEGRAEGREEGRAEGIAEAILIYHDEMNLSSDVIVQRIMSRFNLSEISAREYVASTLNPQAEGEA
jgi:predicted transposase/invertase (TIGR01784 family)